MTLQLQLPFGENSSVADVLARADVIGPSGSVVASLVPAGFNNGLYSLETTLHEAGPHSVVVRLRDDWADLGVGVNTDFATGAYNLTGLFP